MFVRQSRFGMCNNRCGNFRYIGVSACAYHLCISVDLYHVHTTLCGTGRASIIRAKGTYEIWTVD